MNRRLLPANRRLLPAVFVAALIASEPAAAHSVSARFGELYSGLLHPLTTLVHLVPWLALGLLGGFIEPLKSRWVLVAFPASVAAGGLLAAVLPASGWVEALNLASFVVLGALVVLGRKLGFTVFAGLTVVFGLSHGFANNATSLAGGALLLYTLGLAAAAYMLIALTTAFSHALLERTRWGNVAVRAAGSWIVAIGLVFGGYTLLL